VFVKKYFEAEVFNAQLARKTTTKTDSIFFVLDVTLGWRISPSLRIRPAPDFHARDFRNNQCAYDDGSSLYLAEQSKSGCVCRAMGSFGASAMPVQACPAYHSLCESSKHNRR